MQALILAGGQGSRLRPLTLNTPKPIVPIANRPFLLRQIESLKKIGITDITVALNYQPTAIKKVLGDGKSFGVDLRYIVEPHPMGTAGAYKFAERFLDETTIVLNGDILTNVDLQKAARHHRETKAAATIVLTEVENPSAYGLVELDAHCKVRRFIEKPSLEELEKLSLNTINAGIYVLEPRVLKFIPANEAYSFEYQLFPDLLARQENFSGFVARESYWIDIGTPERYLQAHRDWLSGKYEDSLIENSEKLFSEGNGNYLNSAIDKNCKIASDAKIENSFLGENVTVGNNAIVKDSIIWSGTRIGDNVKIFDSILGFDCSIGNQTTIKEEILADKTDIPESGSGFLSL